MSDIGTIWRIKTEIIFREHNKLTKLKLTWLILTFPLVLVYSKVKAQDIILKNPTGKIMYNLDTTFHLDKQRIRVFIGPDVKLAQNTIFFNSPFVLSEMAFDSFRIKGSFLQHFIIRNSTFNTPVAIDSTAFDTLFIEKSIFQDPVEFNNVQIQHFSFTGNTYPGELTFVNCTFKDFGFERSVATSSIKFINCTFENISFRGTDFKRSVDLSGATIPGKLDFDSCVFERNLLLSSLHTSPTTTFSFVNTTLPDTLDFSMNLDIKNIVDLTKTNYNENLKRRCRLMLNKTDLTKVEMNYPFFKLIFPNNVSHDEKETIYEGLLKNFKNKAYQDSYELLDVEYKRFNAKNSTLGFLWWVPDWWWEYGYDRSRVFYWTLGFLAFFTLLNFKGINWLFLKVYKIEKVPIYFKKYGWSRFWYALVFTALVFFSLSVKIDKIDFKEKRGSAYLFLIHIIGLICVAYMANYIIQR